MYPIHWSPAPWLRLALAILVLAVTMLVAATCPDPGFSPTSRKCLKCKFDDHQACRRGYWFYDGVSYCRCCGINDWG